MAALPQILLGLFIGILTFHARFDSLWYSHFGNDISTLKSKVSSSQRSDATAFYKSILNPPQYFNYIVAVSAGLLVISALGQVFQHPRRRVSNTINLLLLVSATAIRYLAYKPIAKIFKTRYIKPDDEAKALYSIALWNTISLVLLICCALIHISAEEEEEIHIKEKKTK